MAKFEQWHNGRKAEGTAKFGADLFVMLNTLAPCYHSAFGYHLDENYYDKGSFFSQVTVPYVKMNLIEDGTLWADTDLIMAEEYAKSNYFQHKFVTVRQTGTIWKFKPSDVTRTWFDSDKEVVKTPLPWYELPERIRGKNALKMVGPLSDRAYIYVTNPYEEVTIDSVEKDSPISIDDVLFATRGVCADDTRSCGGYEVFSNDGTTLILLADIDNWST